jgi:ComEC/Rec2-related protein
MAKATVVFGANVFFIAGIGAGSFGWPPPLVFAFLSACGGVWLVFFRGKKISFYVLLIWAGACAAGLLYFHFFGNFYNLRTILPEGGRALTAVVSREPEARGKIQEFVLALDPPHRGTITAVTFRERLVRYGDRLVISGTIIPAHWPDRARIVFPDIELQKERQGSATMRMLADLRHAFVDRLRAALSLDAAALAAGLTLGITEDFSPAFRESMARSGTTHLVALSGYNILILVTAVQSILLLFLSRGLAYWATLAVIVLFVLLVGGEASVVRAAFMGFLHLLARRESRFYHPRNAIAVTATVMLLFDPSLLVWNIGFQLSFLSLVGITFPAPTFAARFREKKDQTPIAHALRDSFFTTLSAQLLVIPILVASFGEASLTSLLANTLVTSIVPLAMFMSFAAASAGFILPAFGAIVGWFAELPLFSIIGLVRFFARYDIPFPDFFSGWFVIALYYGAIAAIMLSWHRRTLAPHRP